MPEQLTVLRHYLNVNGCDNFFDGLYEWDSSSDSYIIFDKYPNNYCIESQQLALHNNGYYYFSETAGDFDNYWAYGGVFADPGTAGLTGWHDLLNEDLLSLYDPIGGDNNKVYIHIVEE